MAFEDASFIGFAHNTPAPANYIDCASRITRAGPGRESRISLRENWCEMRLSLLLTSGSETCTHLAHKCRGDQDFLGI
jgi:hypothetical protein